MPEAENHLALSESELEEAKERSSVTVHVVPETESQPLQLVKVEPAAGVAVRVTVAPAT